MSEFPKVKTITIEESAKSVDEAIEAGRAKLGDKYTDVTYEIVQEATKGFLGLGAKDAVVRFTAKCVVDEVTAEDEFEPETAIEDTAAEDTAAEPEADQNRYASDDAAQRAERFLSDVMDAMQLDVTVKSVLEDGEVHVELEGEKMGIIIGKRGDTLNSLQYLTSLVVNRGGEGYTRVTIDTENYREKRETALIELSNKLADRVAVTGKKFALEPMNPYERRIIHANLQAHEGVTTFSVGQEPYRKVIIAPKRRKSGRRRRHVENKGRNEQRPSERRTYESRGYESRGREPRGYDSRNNREPRKGYGSRGSYDRRRGGYDSGSGREQRGGYSHSQSYHKQSGEYTSPVTYKADFKPQQHKAEYKNFDEYLAAHTDE